MCDNDGHPRASTCCTNADDFYAFARLTSFRHLSRRRCYNNIIVFESDARDPIITNRCRRDHRITIIVFPVGYFFFSTDDTYRFPLYITCI